MLDNKTKFTLVIPNDFLAKVNAKADEAYQSTTQYILHATAMRMLGQPGEGVISSGATMPAKPPAVKAPYISITKERNEAYNELKALSTLKEVKLDPRYLKLSPAQARQFRDEWKTTPVERMLKLQTEINDLQEWVDGEIEGALAPFGGLEDEQKPQVAIPAPRPPRFDGNGKELTPLPPVDAADMPAYREYAPGHSPEEHRESRNMKRWQVRQQLNIIKEKRAEYDDLAAGGTIKEVTEAEAIAAFRSGRMTAREFSEHSAYHNITSEEYDRYLAENAGEGAQWSNEPATDGQPIETPKQTRF